MMLKKIVSPVSLFGIWLMVKYYERYCMPNMDRAELVAAHTSYDNISTDVICLNQLKHKLEALIQKETKFDLEVKERYLLKHRSCCVCNKEAIVAEYKTMYKTNNTELWDDNNIDAFCSTCR